MKHKTKTFAKSCLCAKCEGQVFGLLNELKSQAIKQKRCGITLDCIGDLEMSLIEGCIESVKRRDSAWKSGNRKNGRRFSVKLE